MNNKEYLTVKMTTDESPDFLIHNKNFILLWLDEGKAEVIFNFRELQLKKRKLYVLGPESISRIHKYSNVRLWTVMFSMDFLQMDGKDYTTDIFRLFFVLMENPAVDINTKLFREFRIIALLLHREYLQTHPSLQILHAYLKVLMLMLMRAQRLDTSISTLNLQRVYDFFALMLSHFKEEKKVSFYARQLSLSSKRLNQLLHMFTRHSASYFIHEQLILEAKRKLITAEYSVKEVADYLGFEDRAYFSRFFKKATGVSPDQFKMAYQ